MLAIDPETLNTASAALPDSSLKRLQKKPDCPKLWDGMNRQIKGFLLVGRATWSSSLISTAATLLFLSQHPPLEASAFMCLAVKSMPLIFGNNGGLDPQRQTHFSLSHWNPCFIFKFTWLIHSALNTGSGRWWLCHFWVSFTHDSFPVPDQKESV